MASNCENYGVVNGSSCGCPTGFGGGNCSQPACGGTIFQGSGRSLANWNSGLLPNITGCDCEDGWSGTGCNVCKTASACQSAYSSAGYSSSSSALSSGTNETLVCNADARVYAAGQLSCAVNVSVPCPTPSPSHPGSEPYPPSSLPSVLEPQHPPHAQPIPHACSKRHRFRLCWFRLRAASLCRR